MGVFPLQYAYKVVRFVYSNLPNTCNALTLPPELQSVGVGTVKPTTGAAKGGNKSCNPSLPGGRVEINGQLEEKCFD
jgi:hypothetical protein